MSIAISSNLKKVYRVVAYTLLAVVAYILSTILFSTLDQTPTAQNIIPTAHGDTPPPAHTCTPTPRPAPTPCVNYHGTCGDGDGDGGGDGGSCA